MISIAPVRTIISRRSPVCSFAVRVAPRHLFEIACATHPVLFGREALALRTPANFWSSRSRGWLRAPRGHAVIHVPADVTRRFGRASRIYYVLAAYPDVHRADAALHAPTTPSFVRVAPEWARVQESLDDDRDFTDLESDDEETQGPAAAAVDAKLAPGMVVWIEIRDANGAVTPLTHEYPIDLDGSLGLPSIAKIDTKEMKISDLRQALAKAVAASAINILPSDKTVDYSVQLKPGDRVYLRLLGADGKPDPSGGSYTIDTDGTLHLPLIGDVDTSHMRLTELQGGLDQGFKRRVSGGVVHVSKDELR